MGLDAYIFAYEEKKIKDKSEVDVKINKNLKAKEIFYWRKHHSLHQWMENLYYAKGGTDQMFNCVKVRLNKEDLDNLEKEIMSKTLYDLDRDKDDGYFDNDMEFLLIARKAIEDKMAIYYDSWW